MREESMLNKREVIIDFKELIVTFIKKWWIIVLIAGFSTVIFCALSYKSAMDRYESAIELNSLNSTQLSQSDLEEVDDYLDYYETLQGWLEYKDNSIYMQLNAEKVATNIAQYSIATKEKGDIDSISKLYADYINSGAVVADLVKLDSSYANMYLKDVISCNGMTSVEGNLSSAITVTIRGREIEETIKLAELFKTAIESYRNRIVELNVKEHEVTLVNSYEYEYIDTNLYTNQEKIKTDILNLQTQVNSLKDKFTNAQLKELAVRLNMEMDNVSDVTDENESVKIDITTVFTGIIMGIMFGCVIVFCMYLFSGLVKSKKEIQMLLNTRDLGNVILTGTGRVNNFIRKYIYKEYSIDNSVSITAAKISRTCASIDNIHFVGVLTEKSKGELIQCKEIISNNFNKIFIWRDLVNSPDAIQLINKESSVILVIELWNTKYSELIDTVRFCEQQEIEVAGYITIVK